MPREYAERNNNFEFNPSISNSRKSAQQQLPLSNEQQISNKEFNQINNFKEGCNNNNPSHIRYYSKRLTVTTALSATETGAPGGSCVGVSGSNTGRALEGGVRCGRREWTAAQTLVKLNTEEATTNSTVSGPISPTEGSVAPTYYSNTLENRTEWFSPRHNAEDTQSFSSTSTSLSGVSGSAIERGSIGGRRVPAATETTAGGVRGGSEVEDKAEVKTTTPLTKIITTTTTKTGTTAPAPTTTINPFQVDFVIEDRETTTTIMSTTPQMKLRKMFKTDGIPEQVIFYAPPTITNHHNLEKQQPQQHHHSNHQNNNIIKKDTITTGQSILNSIYRERSIEETEAAHDLLSLSQSLPPLPAPCVVTILKQQEEPNHHFIISNSQVMQEISNSSTCHHPHTHSHIHQNSHIIQHPGNNSHHSDKTQRNDIDPKPSHMPMRCSSYDSNTENCSPLTPPISEHSSDIEVELSSSSEMSYPAHDLYRKLPQDELWNPELIKIKKEKEVFIIDGRTKNRKNHQQPTSSSGDDIGNGISFGGKCSDSSTSSPTTTTTSNKLSKSRKGNYKCSECGRQYATSSNLSRHKQTHRSLDSQSAKKCNTCGKAYVSMPALAMHLLTHKLTHSCGICGKLFSRPWLLQGHLRSHTGEKPYACAHCGKAFADRSNLRAHMQTHSADKNFECNRCHKTFALKSYLNKHLESACLKDKESMFSSDDNDEDIVVT